MTETKSDDLRKFVAEQKETPSPSPNPDPNPDPNPNPNPNPYPNPNQETRRFDDKDLGEIAYKEITEKRY